MYRSAAAMTVGDRPVADAKTVRRLPIFCFKFPITVVLQCYYHRKPGGRGERERRVRAVKRAGVRASSPLGGRSFPRPYSSKLENT